MREAIEHFTQSKHRILKVIQCPRAGTGWTGVLARKVSKQHGAGAIVEGGLKYLAEKGFEDVVDGTRILPSVEACR